MIWRTFLVALVVLTPLSSYGSEKIDRKYDYVTTDFFTCSLYARTLSGRFRRLDMNEYSATMAIQAKWFSRHAQKMSYYESVGAATITEIGEYILQRIKQIQKHDRWEMKLIDKYKEKCPKVRDLGRKLSDKFWPKAGEEDQ